MDEKLNIGTALPISGTSFKVKGLDSNKQKPQDRNFEKHLKENRKKDGDKEQITDHGLDVLGQSQKTVFNSGSQHKNQLEGKQRKIDVLA